MSSEVWLRLSAQTLLENSPFSSVVYDAAGHPLFANAAFTRMWGVDLSSAPPGYSVLQDPELERQGALDTIRRAFEGEITATPPVRYDISKVSATGSGRVLWTQGHFMPIRDLDGKIALVVLTHIDLTERMQAEQSVRRALGDLQHLQTLTSELAAAASLEEVADIALEHARPAFGAAAAAISLVDDQTGEVFNIGAVGFTAEQMQSWRRYSLRAGVVAWDVVRTGAPVFATTAQMSERYPLFVGTVQKQGYQYLAAFPLQTRGPVFGLVTFLFEEADGADSRALESMSAFANQCAVAIERARLYDAERAARAEAEHANRAKAEFLAVMSHELRTPLNAISGYAELMELGIRGPINEAQRADLQRIQRSQKHLLSLIDDVLSFARIESGRVDYHLIDARLDTVIAEAHEIIAPQVLAKGLRLEVVHSARGLLVRADVEKLRQILLNILSNAVKYTEHGSITVLVHAHERFAVIEVTDTGVGIPAAHQAVIFEPFVQIDKGLTRRGSGTGLGLAIARDLARRMDGDITVRSAEGRGSTFIITIPLAEAT